MHGMKQWNNANNSHMPTYDFATNFEWLSVLHFNNRNCAGPAPSPDRRPWPTPRCPHCWVLMLAHSYLNPPSKLRADVRKWRRTWQGSKQKEIGGWDVRMVIIEEPSRLARQVLTYELAVVLLQSRGVEVYASNGDCLTATEDEMATAMRQIVMVFSELA